MTKVNIIIICFLLLRHSSTCVAQHSLKKNEIYRDWIKSHPASINCNTAITQLTNNTILDKQLHETIQSLRGKGVDTIAVLIISHPGTLTADTSNQLNYTEEAYIFWRIGGGDLLKKISGKSVFNDDESNCSPVFDFFSQHHVQLEQEHIMPVILKATKQANKIVYYRVMSSDIDEYILCYSVHGHCKRFAFTQADIKNKSNLFYVDNLESQVYKWFKNLLKESNVSNQLILNKRVENKGVAAIPPP